MLAQATLKTTTAAIKTAGFLCEAASAAIVYVLDLAATAEEALYAAQERAARAVVENEIQAAETARNVAEKAYAASIVALHQANAESEAAQEAYLQLLRTQEARVQALLA